jgi:penicillin-binding protein 1A
MAPARRAAKETGWRKAAAGNAASTPPRAGADRAGSYGTPASADGMAGSGFMPAGAANRSSARSDGAARLARALKPRRPLAGSFDAADGRADGFVDLHNNLNADGSSDARGNLGADGFSDVHADGFSAAHGNGRGDGRGNRFGEGGFYGAYADDAAAESGHAGGEPLGNEFHDGEHLGGGYSDGRQRQTGEPDDGHWGDERQGGGSYYADGEMPGGGYSGGRQRQPGEPGGGHLGDERQGGGSYYADGEMPGGGYSGGRQRQSGEPGGGHMDGGELDPLDHPGNPDNPDNPGDPSGGEAGCEAGGEAPPGGQSVWRNVLRCAFTGIKWVLIYMGRFIATVFKTAAVIVMVVAFGVAGAGIGAVYGYIQNVEPITSDMLEIKVLTSYIYDADGNELARLTGRENINRVPVKYDSVAAMLPKAFIAIEDERFESHNGVDLKRIASAALGFVTNAGDSHGASTITQQLVKHLTDNKLETLERKVQEWYLAIELEKSMEKWKILELYMNLIYFNNGCYGVQSASMAYFGKDVSELSIAECAFLAGIPNYPSRYNPYTEKGKAAAYGRQRDVLKKMFELGMISQREYDAAVTERLTIIPKQAAVSVTKPHTYFVDAVINDVKNDLMSEKGMTDTMALMTIYSNGLKIYATQSSSIQAAMDEVFNNDEFFPKTNPDAINNDEQPQSAMVVLDPVTAQIKAMYGGYGEKLGSSTFNRATQARRQPGSSIKPIAVYAPALDMRAITPASVFDDSPMHLDPNDPSRIYPSNSNNRFAGLTTVRSAVRRSVNVVAAKVWGMIPDASLSYLDKVGINRDGERRVALALGGLNKGVTPLEMAAAYAPFVNRGMYYEPATYTRVLDSNGKVLLDKTSRQPTIVYSEQAAFLMTSMLQDVVKSGGTGTAAALADGAMPSAGKTGTTNDNADRWFVGYTPYYVAATWYGYDNSIKKITLASDELNNAMLIWKAVMEKAHESLEPKEFSMPDQIVSASVCVYSGKAPTEYCASDPRGNAIRTEYFIRGTEPKASDPCDVHTPVVLCGSTSDLLGSPVLAGPYCPPESLRTTVVVRRPVQPERLPGDPYPSDWEYEYAGYPTCPYHTEYGIAPEFLPDGGVSGDGLDGATDDALGGAPGDALGGSVSEGGASGGGASAGGVGERAGNGADGGGAGTNAVSGTGGVDADGTPSQSLGGELVDPASSAGAGSDVGGAGNGTATGAAPPAEPGRRTASPARTPRPSAPAASGDGIIG